MRFRRDLFHGLLYERGADYRSLRMKLHKEAVVIASAVSKSGIGVVESHDRNDDQIHIDGFDKRERRKKRVFKGVSLKGVRKKTRHARFVFRQEGRLAYGTKHHVIFVVLCHAGITYLYVTLVRSHDEAMKGNFGLHGMVYRDGETRTGILANSQQVIKSLDQGLIDKGLFRFAH